MQPWKMNRLEKLSYIGATAMSPHKVEVTKGLGQPADVVSDQRGTLDGLEDPLSHLIETLLVEVYRCSVCKSFFPRRSTIQSHIQLHHSPEDGASSSTEVGSVPPRSMPECGGKGGPNPVENCSADKDALNSVLEVLVGLCNPSVVPELTQGTNPEEEVTPSPELSDNGDSSIIVYNLSEVSVDEGNSLILPAAGNPDNIVPVESIHAGDEDNDKTSSDHHGGVPDRLEARHIFKEVCPKMVEPLAEQNASKFSGRSTNVLENKTTSDNSSDVFIIDRNPTDISGNIGIFLDPTLQQVSLSSPCASPNASHDTGEELYVDKVPGYPVHPSVKDDPLGRQTTPGATSLDINRLVQSASASHPDASSFIVASHSGLEDRPSEMLQFKRSWKSNAIIPTTKSLGIVSPFPRRQRTSKKIFRCQACSSRYATEKELVNHIAKKHLRKSKFLCEVCGVAMLSKGALRNHVFASHSESLIGVLQCETCDYRTRHRKHFTNHMNKHGRGFWCEPCDQTFSSASRLEIHCRSLVHINRVEPLACQHCEYTTYKKDNLRVHMRKHDDERPYKCSRCDYASRDSGTLKKHVMAKHSKIRPHHCDQCDFSSVDRRGLNIHLRKHSGERPFKCPICSYSARRRNTLNRHLKTHQKKAPCTSGSSGRAEIHVLLDLPQ